MNPKYRIFRFYLKVLQKLAVNMQLGNPLKKAPTLINEFQNQEKIFGLNDSAYNINVWQFYNVICSGLYGGAIINENNQVSSRFLLYPWGKDVHPILTFPYLGKKISTVNKVVYLLTAAAKGNYYHWVADLLPRLLLIKACNLSDLHERFVILHHPSKTYEIEILKLLDVKEEKVIRLAEFNFIIANDIVVGDYYPSTDGESFPYWKRALIQEFKNKILPTKRNEPTEKLYLVRGKQKYRNLIGEEKLIDFLKKKGFWIIDGNNMSFLEQVNALSKAKIVISPHGAALTNILFCEEKTLIIELRSTHCPPEFFSEIAKTCNLQFKSISLYPKRRHKAFHLANKQDLILSEKDIKLINHKLSVIIQ